MKLIILAAGKGERLLPLTKNTPKPLLDLGNGNTLLEEQLERARESGVVDEVVLVIGYLAEQVEAKLKTWRVSPMPLRTIFNPFFHCSNNLASLWLAQHAMDGDFLITNGDNLFAPQVFAGLTRENEGAGVYLTTRIKSAYDEDDMKITLEGERIRRVSKEIDSATAQAESVGLALVRGETYQRLFREHLDVLMRDPAYLNRFWLEVFNSMQAKGIAIRPWYLEGGDEVFQEVDFHLDISKARGLLEHKLARVTAARAGADD